jgi:hypothetical protein
VLAVLSRFGERLSHIGGISNFLAADIEDHVANLDVAPARGPIGIETNYCDTTTARAGNVVRGVECQANMRQIIRQLIASRFGLCLLFIRHFAERQIHGFELALVQQCELDAGSGRQHPNPAGKIARAFIDLPLIAVITSPMAMPALSAGLSGCG